MRRLITLMGGLVIAGLFNYGLQAANKIVHDSEYYILEKQNGERWSVEDTDLDKRLAKFRNKNGGKSPNIFYVLIDDIGFGDLAAMFHPMFYSKVFWMIWTSVETG